MKVALLGDTHFGARGDNPVFHQFFKDFYDDIFFPYLDEHGVDYVVQLGDVFDRRKYINFQTLKNSKEYFFEPLNQKYKSWLLIGNHDTYYKNTNSVNSLDLILGQYSNINTIHHPYETSFGDVSFLMIPWICSENEKEVFEAIKISKAQICCGHFEISGFEMYKGAIIDEGLDANIFSKFEFVFSGHYHHRSTKRNITYVGTPYEITWSDYSDQKGFHIFDTNTREVEFIPNPLSMFIKVHYDDLNKTIEDVLLDDFSIYNKTIVKVVVRNKTNPYWFDMFIEKLEKAGVIDIQVVDDHYNLNLEEDKDIVNEAEDTLTILNKYITQVNVNTDKQKLENLLRSLYSEALTLE